MLFTSCYFVARSPIIRHSQISWTSCLNMLSNRQVHRKPVQHIWYYFFRNILFISHVRMNSVIWQCIIWCFYTPLFPYIIAGMPTYRAGRSPKRITLWTVWTKLPANIPFEGFEILWFVLLCREDPGAVLKGKAAVISVGRVVARRVGREVKVRAQHSSKNRSSGRFQLLSVSFSGIAEICSHISDCTTKLLNYLK